MRGYYGPPWAAGGGRRASTGVPASELRVSDAERHELAEVLSAHFADGRLDQAEFDERMGRAMGAKTRGDLDGLLADLPPLLASRGEPTPAAPRRHRSAMLLWVVGAFLLLRSAGLGFTPWWPWHRFGWYGGPHLPVLLVVLVLLALARRRRFRRATGWTAPR